jgi:hypothetical protein
VESEGISLEQAIAELKQLMPPYAVLVGLNIRQDVTWLGLKEGVDFQVRVDGFANSQTNVRVLLPCRGCRI